MTRIPVSRIRDALSSHVRCRLRRNGKFRGFCTLKADGSDGRSLHGLTVRLTERIFSSGALPESTTKARSWRGRRWAGAVGGRRRGTAVDSQLSQIANGKRSASASCMRLTQMVLRALTLKKYRLVCGQRAVCSPSDGIGTAVDLVCVDDATNALVLLELKCGFDGNRQDVVQVGGRVQKLRAPLTNAADCAYHRHILQLAVTSKMFDAEVDTRRALKDAGVESVRAELVYACDADVEFIGLDSWWSSRAGVVLQNLR